MFDLLWGHIYLVLFLLKTCSPKGTVYPIKTAFSTKCPNIVIKESTSGRTLTQTQMPPSSEDPEDLTEEEQKQLKAGS